MPLLKLADKIIRANSSIISAQFQEIISYYIHRQLGVWRGPSGRANLRTYHTVVESHFQAEHLINKINENCGTKVTKCAPR